jgi:hypothetical protein
MSQCKNQLAYYSIDFSNKKYVNKVLGFSINNIKACQYGT